MAFFKRRTLHLVNTAYRFRLDLSRPESSRMDSVRRTAVSFLWRNYYVLFGFRLFGLLVFAPVFTIIWYKAKPPPLFFAPNTLY